MMFAVLLLAVSAHGSQYVSYVPGNMPLVITAPHGGDKNPSSFPERSIDTNARSSEKYCGYLNAHGFCQYAHSYDKPRACTSKHYRKCKVPHLKDSYTYSIATRLAESIERLSGKRPHLVRMELKRNKIDANRELAEATFGARQTVEVYREYERTIQQAKAAAGQVGLLLDIHGQSHSHGMVELGYTVSGVSLDCGISCYSPLLEPSIRALINRRCNSNTACGEDILRGSTSLGNFLSQQGYSVIPSPSNRSPRGRSYYSGGYTTKTYGSKWGGSFDAIQVEIPRHERFDSAARTSFINALASAVVSFMRYHYGV